jgi:hypothetical protein
MLVAQPVRFSIYYVSTDTATNHDRVAKYRRGRVLLVGKLGHELATDRVILPKLLLKPLGVSLEASEEPVIRRNEHGRDVGQKPAKIYTAPCGCATSAHFQLHDSTD